MEQKINPYASPKSNPVVPEEPVAPVPASKSTRFMNFIIDYVMQIIIVIGYMVIAAVIGGDEAVTKLEEMPSVVLGLFALIPYYLVMEASIGRTVGKLITGTKVVNEDGQKASFGQILGRTFARLIPFEAFSFLGAESRGWHDSMPRTYVVKCR